MAPHPLGATLGPAAIGPRRKEPLLAAEIIRLLEERHGVPWDQAVREAAGLMAQTVEEAEGWWAFDMAHEESPPDEEMIAQKRAESRSSQPSSSSEIKEAIGAYGEAMYWRGNGQGKAAAIDATKARLESLYLEQREDAARWRAVLPILTVRNVGLAAYASTNEFSPDFTWRKTWLESRKPLEGVALNPIEFADALRALSTKGTAK